MLSVHRIRITYADGGGEVYLVPLSWRDHAVEDLSSALIGVAVFFKSRAAIIARTLPASRSAP